MTIKDIFIYECKGYYKGKYHKFECVDTNRKVDIDITGEVVCKIKHWIDFFSKNKGEYFQKWDKIFRFHLIADGINPHIENGQHYVKLNYQFLNDKKLLTHNKALFLLLGLDAYELGRGIKERDLQPLNCEEDPTLPIESTLWNTAQNQALLTSSYFRDDGKITSKKLKKLANDYGFFTKHNDYLANRNMDEAIAKELHKLLENSKYITGEFDDLWKWKAQRNELSYLAKQLSYKRILKGKCHKELSYYILDPSTAKRPLKNIKDPAPKNRVIIDNIIKQLTA